MIASQVDNPILLVIKKTQEVFNGYGAQEATDMLMSIFISPLMPTYLVCQDEDLWQSFQKRSIEYQKEGLEIWKTNQFPFTSGSKAF